MAISELPEEIIIDIFSRPPSKSVGKCRCLSKPLRTKLSSPKFIKSHLNRKTLNQQNLLLITTSNSIHTIDTIKDGSISRKLALRDDWIEVVGACDGLVVLANKKDEMFLVNPITQQMAKVPSRPLAIKKEGGRYMHGFGYDSSTDDYKIVTLSYYETEDLDMSVDVYCVKDLDMSVDVYCVKEGVWKRVMSSPNYHAARARSYGAFVNGAIHWLASSRERNYPSVIAAFDLAREVFDEIPAPNGVNLDAFVFNKLVVLGGCLCMSDTSYNNIWTDIWIMKEYGVAESWTKFSIYGEILSEYRWDVSKYLCYIGDEEVVLVTEEQTLVIYNLKEQTLRHMVVDGVPATNILDGGIFVGSLVSPC